MAEYHLFIIWEEARKNEENILSDIAGNFDILYKVNVTWSKKYFSSNLTRFYGTNLPPNSDKEQHIGTGDFLVVVVEDHIPDYNHHETSKGSKYINSRTFLAKTRYRDSTGGGHKIHGTNTPAEFSHDFALLFGCSIDEFMQKNTVSTEKTINLKRNIVGYNGWASIEQLFSVLNLSEKYVVMRNWQQLPDNYYAEAHGDIDLLVDDFESVRYTLNAERVFPEDHRVHCKTKINGKDVFFDFRFIGDGYYDKAWQRKILGSRRLDTTRNIFVVDEKNHFFSLMYHAIIHKPNVAEDYTKALKTIAEQSKVLANVDAKKIIKSQEMCKMLGRFLAQHSYQITKPEPSVYFNESHVQLTVKYAEEYKDKFQVEQLKDIYKFDSIERFESVQKDERRFYKATKDQDAFFVKSSSVSYGDEFRFAKIAHDENSSFFAKPIEFYDGEVNYFVTQWVDGVGLDEYMAKDSVSTRQKKTLIKDLVSIQDILWNLGIVHRDIIPRNFIVSADGRLVLIDFYWAVDACNYQEYDYVKKNIEHIRHLGEDFSAGEYQWDDAVSFIKIAELILGEEAVNSDTLLNGIKQRVGERVVRPDGLLFQAIIDKERARGSELQNEIRSRDERIVELQHHYDGRIAELQAMNNDLINSRSWRITKPVRAAAKMARKVKRSSHE